MTSARAIVRSGIRGLVAAMAMSGARMLFTNSGLLERTPPQAIVERHAPRAVRKLPEAHRSVMTELAHWGYGTAAGMAFALLPRRLRARKIAGPAYGLLVWLAFETGLAPLLDLEHVRNRRFSGRLVLAADHLLYGFIVSDRLPPDPATAPGAQKAGRTPGAA